MKGLEKNPEIQNKMREWYEKSSLQKEIEERSTAIEVIKQLENNQNLEVEYLSSSISDYDENRAIERYSTENGVYEIYSDINEIFSFESKNLSKNNNKTVSLEKEVLKNLAETFIKKQLEIDFNELIPKHGQKSENFFFRWEPINPSTKNNVIEFIQVGIKTDGTIFSFTNALSETKNKKLEIPAILEKEIKTKISFWQKIKNLFGFN